MLGIFRWIGSGIKSIGQAIALPFTQVRSSSRLQSIVRWTIHGLAVGGTLAGLWFLNYTMRLDSMLLTPFPLLRSIWLPLLGLQIYVVSWIGWWLCRAMTSPRSSGDFPDLNKAWSQVESALTKANIDLQKTPLFLFIGDPTDSTSNFFNAGKVARTIQAAPHGDDAPFQVYANEDAVYLCCESVSLLGAQADLFNRANANANDAQANYKQSLAGFGSAKQKFPSEPVSADAAFAAQSVEKFSPGPADRFPAPEIGGTATRVRPTSAPVAVDNSLAARSLALIESNLSLLERENSPTPDSVNTLATNAGVYQPKRKMKIPLLVDESVIDSKTSRLTHLCKIISESRSPFCPINGVVSLIPYAATANEEVANHTGMLIERDLQAIAATTMVNPPIIAVVTDLQQANGSTELIARFPEEQRHRRLGIKFPRVPDCDRKQMEEMVRSGMHWLCQQMVPPIVNRLFQTERNPSEAEPVNVANRRLFGFANEIRRRQSALTRLVRRAFLGNHQNGALLRGCYLSASGKDTITQQAFTAGILSQIHEMQNDVQWTPGALHRDSEFNRWAIMGYIALGAIVAIILAGILI